MKSLVILLFFMSPIALADTIIPIFETSEYAETTWGPIDERIGIYQKGLVGCQKYFKDTVPSRIIRLNLGTYQIYCTNPINTKMPLSYLETDNSKNYIQWTSQSKRYTFPDKFMRESGFFSIFK
jgi:hypothetical protein